MKFCVDPGHGGLDSGAVGRNWLEEKTVVLSISRWVAEGLLEAGHEVMRTREEDVAVTLKKRCKLANEWGADVFISIHANASEAIGPGGFEVFTSPGWTQADPIATAIFNSIRESFPELRGRVDSSDGDPDKESRFFVLAHTNMAAALVETAFISNPREERFLKDPGWRLRMAGAIVSGLCQ